MIDAFLFLLVRAAWMSGMKHSGICFPLSVQIHKNAAFYLFGAAL